MEFHSQLTTIELFLKNMLQTSQQPYPTKMHKTYFHLHIHVIYHVLVVTVNKPINIVHVVAVNITSAVQTVQTVQTVHSGHTVQSAADAAE